MTVPKNEDKFVAMVTAQAEVTLPLGKIGRAHV